MKSKHKRHAVTRDGAGIALKRIGGGGGEIKAGGEMDGEVTCDALVIGLPVVAVGRFQLKRIALTADLPITLVKAMARPRAVPQAVAEKVHAAVGTLYKEAGLDAPNGLFRVVSVEDYVATGRKARPAAPLTTTTPAN